MLEQQAIVGKPQDAAIAISHIVQEPPVDVSDDDGCGSGSDDEQRPVAQELFSGPRAPTLQALRWCGWRTLAPYDILLGGLDLADAAVQQEVLDSRSRVDARVAGICCKTLTRAREKPIPGCSRPPVPLRSAEFPDGIPDQNGKLPARICRANEAADFTMELMDQCEDEFGAAGVIENPGNSWLWRREKAIRLEQKPGWRRRPYKACAWMGARCKSQGVLSDVMRWRWWWHNVITSMRKVSGGCGCVKLVG